MHRILIAEDEARIASFIEKGLRSHGYTTTVAVTSTHILPSQTSANPPSAVAYLDTHPLCLLLSAANIVPEYHQQDHRRG